MEIPDLKIRVVTSPEDVEPFWQWLTHPRGGMVAVDLETGAGTPDGNPLEWWKPGCHARMVQFGNALGGWAIPFQDWPRLVEESFKWIERSRTKHVWHNGFDYDSKVLQHCHGIKLDITTLEDTFVWSGLVGYAGDFRGLKTVAEDELGAWAGAGQELLKNGMKNGKWNWTTVPMGWQPYPVYGVQDTCMTALLWEKWEPQRKQFQAQHELEIAVSAYTNAMSINGMTVDGTYVQEKYREWKRRADLLAAKCRELGATPNQNDAIRKILMEADALDQSRLTEGGVVRVDKLNLQYAKDKHPLAALVLEAKSALIVADRYLGKLWNLCGNQPVPTVIHPSINSMEARTHRMCLPDSHKLMTKRGVVGVEDIQIGDQTVSEDGSWTTVQEVFRYADQETIKWDTTGVHLEATAEHRWVTYLEKPGSPMLLEPFTGKGRRRIRLVPDVEPADLTSRNLTVKTDSERFAAIVGMLVSDGRVVEGGYGRGMNAYVYQTEDKFYDEFMSVIPAKAISYDRVSAATKSGPHHEIRLKTRWLRPLLEAAGLNLDEGKTLRESASLVPWVLGLGPDETWAFLQTVWLADGTTGDNLNKVISCGSEPLREALQIAAYRCGWRSLVINDGMGGWSTKDRLAVRMKRGWTSSRYLTETPGRADVWCVRTSNGTFTAWGPEGPYLTGNSVSEPAAQQFPATDPTVRNAVIPRNPGEVLVTADFGQIEVRGWASATGDQAMLDDINTADATGSDFFTLMGRRITHEPDFDRRKDPRGKQYKNTTYATLYDASPPKISEMTGMPLEDVQNTLAEMRSVYPSFRDAGRSMIEDLGGGEAQITLPSGRVYRVRNWGDQRKLPNYRVQGWAAEVLKTAIVRCGAAGMGPNMVLPVHDELVNSVPRKDAEDFAAELKIIMDSVVDPKEYGVSVTATPVIGERWGALKD